MSEAPTLMLSGVAGIALGAFFFGGLWWTVRKGLSSGEPALWFFPSSVLRTAVAVAGFYFVSGGQWARVVACLFGFFIANRLVVWLSGPKRDDPRRSGKEVDHAPYTR